MRNDARRDFLKAVCATLLYGVPFGASSQAPAPERPRIALLLPLSSTAFGRAADSVRQGFLNAAQLDPAEKFDIAVYSTTDDPANIVAGYEQAIAESARLVVGPLTRNGISAVALRIRPGTPVLALNVPENDVALPEGVYAFSLQLEADARQVARMAYDEGRRSALVLSDTLPLARRIQKAFTEEFTRLGGRIAADFVFRSNTADLVALREATTSGQSDMAFLCVDHKRARIARAYIDNRVAIYGTSQLLEGSPDRMRDAELNGIRFVAMPWLLQADHPAVMTYTRTPNSLPAATDFERLYAFGIDAYRIAADLLRSGEIARTPLDGVTGRISLGAERLFARELTGAQYVDGQPAALMSRP